jgi:hypothetical protein
MKIARWTEDQGHHKLYIRETTDGEERHMAGIKPHHSIPEAYYWYVTFENIAGGGYSLDGLKQYLMKQLDAQEL